MEVPGHENILVVDDEIELREAISAYLSQEGYEVQQASSGEEALDLLKKNAFDILITDMKLPGLDGNTVLQEALAIYPEIIWHS